MRWNIIEVFRPWLGNGRKRNRANPQVSDTKDYWWIILYYQSLEHLLNGFRVRLVKNEDRFDYLVMYTSVYIIFVLGTGLSRWDCSISSCLDTWRKIAM
jgi:hypothetical protein